LREIQRPSTGKSPRCSDSIENGRGVRYHGGKWMKGRQRRLRVQCSNRTHRDDG
jgi:hypothetical protein